jgi:hypothetical protein
MGYAAAVQRAAGGGGGGEEGEDAPLSDGPRKTQLKIAGDEQAAQQ